MATQTRVLATATEYDAQNQPIGTCSLELDYDDVSMRATRLRCVNNTSAPAYAEVVRKSDGLIYGQRFPAQQTTFITIPTNQVATRIGVTLNAADKITSISAAFLWPYA